MGLLKRDPWKHGVRATATVERVHVTEFVEVKGTTDTANGAPFVFLTFQFADQDGAVVTQARKFAIWGTIPAPGSTVDVAYPPGDPAKVEYDRGTVRPPDPGVPRGWSAGIFAVDDLGGHEPSSIERVAKGFGLLTPSKGTSSPIGALVQRLGGPQVVDDDAAEIAAQRELFRSGRRATARIVSLRPTKRLRDQNIEERAITLEVDDGTVEATAFLAYVPSPGDEIEVAISPDGSRVALDSDERLTSDHTAQGLVVTTPDGVLHMRTREGKDAAAAERAQREIADDLRAGSKGGSVKVSKEQLAKMKDEMKRSR